ncbi:MAG: YqjK family protein [Burkholderiaceae bacterium]
MTNAQYRTLLAARRERLVQRAQCQRRQLAQSALPLVRAAAWVERGFGVWRTLQDRPWLVLALAAALTLWRPRRVLRALPVLLALWRAGAKLSVLR